MLDNKVQHVTAELIQNTLHNEMQQFMQSLQTQHQMAQQIQQEQQQNHPSSNGQDPYSYHMQGGEYSGHMNQQGTPQHPIYHLDSFRGGVISQLSMLRMIANIRFEEEELRELSIKRSNSKKSNICRFFELVFDLLSCFQNQRKTCFASFIQ